MKETRKGKRGLLIAKYALAFLGAMIMFLLFYTVTVIGNAPKIDASNIYSYLNESSIVYDDEGEMVDSLYIDNGNRINVDYEDLPSNLINAVISIEDKTFWEHHGFNIKRIFGAIWESAFKGGRISGTSTITQQLARNVYLPDTKGVRSLNRKISEAWYTVQLEQKLSKKKIIEAYLNTIYLGNNSYGVEAAANSYFSKSVGELNLLESAALAAIPYSPNSYALVQNIDNETIESEAIDLKKKDILLTTESYTTVYNGDVSEERRDLTLDLMVEEGYISSEEASEARSTSLKDDLDLDDSTKYADTAYFTDFLADEILEDLEAEGYSEKAARNMLYTGGLKIYSTMNDQAQTAVADAFSVNSNFPTIDWASINYDSNSNILDEDGDVMLYAYKNYISSNGTFTLKDTEYEKNSSGDIVLLKGKRLTFNKTTTDGKTDYTIEFRPIYKVEDGTLYSIENSVLNIPQKYKSMDGDGNLVVDAEFFTDYKDTFKKSGTSYVVSENGYTLSNMMRQPQGAMVICDYKTGAIKAMVGGRETTGRLLYNRADETRQPGSSIKPLSIYSTALKEGEEAAEDGTPMTFKKYDDNDKISKYGDYWTAASKINDAPLYIDGKLWPKNAYSGYKGLVTMRKSLEQSINVNAVRIFLQLDSSDIIDQLKKFGITSVVESGDTNDNNAAALALGGMTNGISPLEMASAYGTFPNEGTHVEYTAYTKVEDSSGNVILESDPEETRVLSEGVAFIMSDMLRTVVTKGIGGNAQVSGKVTAGKTGTTSEKYDIWFCGFTPQYSAAIWLGNDVNIELNQDSSAAATFWSKVMTKATEGMSGSLPSKPSSVIKRLKEYYISGTQPSLFNDEEEDENKIQYNVTTCTKSGYAATPNCPTVQNSVVDEDSPATKYFCPIHNPDPDIYTVAPEYR